MLKKARAAAVHPCRSGHVLSRGVRGGPIVFHSRGVQSVPTSLHVLVERVLEYGM
jgi:hypothetical protein